MTRYATCLRTLLTLSLVLTGISASQAGRWYARNGYYYYPACSAVTVSTPPAANIPAAGQPMAATPAPTVYTVMKPVTGENAGNPAVIVPQSGSYVPAAPAYPSSGWSTTPRSSWDYGSFPPYH